MIVLLELKLQLPRTDSQVYRLESPLTMDKRIQYPELSNHPIRARVRQGN